MNPTASQAATATSDARMSARGRSSPTVSVIVQCSRREFVDEALRNLAAQSLRPHEILIVGDKVRNDAAGPNGAKRTTTRFIPGDANSTNTFMQGMEEASGDYIQLLNTHDLLSLSKLEHQARAMETSRAQVACGPWAWMTIESNRTLIPNRVQAARQLPDARSLLCHILDEWSFCIQSCLFRRSFLDGIELRPGDPLSSNHHLGLLARVLAKNPEVVYCDESLALRATTEPASRTARHEPAVETRVDFLARIIQAGHKALLETPEFKARLTETARTLDRNHPDAAILQYYLANTSGDDSKGPSVSSASRDRKHRRPRHSAGPITGRQLRMIEELGFTLT